MFEKILFHLICNGGKMAAAKIKILMVISMRAIEICPAQSKGFAESSLGT